MSPYRFLLMLSSWRATLVDSSGLERGKRSKCDRRRPVRRPSEIVEAVLLLPLLSSPAAAEEEEVWARLTNWISRLQFQTTNNLRMDVKQKENPIRKERKWLKQRLYLVVAGIKWAKSAGRFI